MHPNEKLGGRRGDNLRGQAECGAVHILNGRKIFQHFVFSIFDIIHIHV